MDDWSSTLIEHDLPASEKLIRDGWVDQYLVDYDPTAAAQRIGYPLPFAAEVGARFLREAYVQWRIKFVELHTADIEREEGGVDERYDRKRIVKALFREAHNTDKGSSHSARVAALGKLASIHGMEAAKKKDITVNTKGGVLYVPAIADIDEWEEVAMAQQAELQHDTRNG